MRARVIQEGVLAPNGVYIAPGALSAGQPVIPVVFAADHYKPIGRATDFERDDDGWITFEIDMLEEHRWIVEPDERGGFIYGEFSCSSMLDEATWDVETSRHDIHKARITAICVIVSPGFPKNITLMKE